MILKRAGYEIIHDKPLNYFPTGEEVEGCCDKVAQNVTKCFSFNQYRSNVRQIQHLVTQKSFNVCKPMKKLALNHSLNP